MATTTIEYFRLHDGTLAALASNGGRSVAAVVHPRRPGGTYRWALAGDLHDHPARPQGIVDRVTVACAEAAAALGSELGLEVAGYTVEGLEAVPDV